MPKGKLIVIDGTDGSGKKTQTKLLIERLRQEGYPVETVAFPRYGEKSAALVEEYLAGKFGTADQVGPKAGSIFYAADRYAAGFQIKEWLESGINVVIDRYVSANMGHQGGKIADPEERRRFFEWNDDLEHGIFGIPRPDLTLILHCPAVVGQRLSDQRDGAAKDIHQADLQHLKDAEASYLMMADMFDEMRLVSCCPADKLLPREQIHDIVWREVEPLLAKQPA